MELIIIVKIKNLINLNLSWIARSLTQFSAFLIVSFCSTNQVHAFWKNLEQLDQAYSSRLCIKLCDLIFHQD